jgi:hypothetical protein
LAYNIGKWHDDMYLFTDKGDWIWVNLLKI